VVPQPGPALAGQMAFYLSALQSGDIKAWLGESARTALDRAGRGATVSKIDGELKRAAAGIDRPEAEAAGWRGQAIPINNGAAGAPIAPVQLYVHQTKPDDDGGNQQKGGGKAPTRFLLDLDLSALGKIQLDGLAQPPRFDLILRTERALPEAVRNQLRLLFTDITSARGLSGSVGFQVAPPIVPGVTGSAPPRPGILV
jgi:hypothetical protein